MKLTRLTSLFLGLSFLTCVSCGKEFLAIKQDKSVRTPNSIADYQALMDHQIGLLNIASCHELGMIGGDESYLVDGRWSSLSQPYQRNAYVWAQDVYEGDPLEEWEEAYERILYANMVLEGIENVVPSNAEMAAWNSVKGSALFYRGWNHYQLAQQFCGVYQAKSAATDMGIPLRLESDVTVKSMRSTVADTYRSILNDLETAAELLPIVSANKMRPSKAAALALLSRVSLQMGAYETAAQYAASCLGIHNELLDFNTLDTTKNASFEWDYGMTNPEVLFMCYLLPPAVLGISRMNIDTELLNMYGSHDLRKPVYFGVGSRGNVIMKGAYVGEAAFFTGLAVDEVYLNLAESYARLGRTDDALGTLNTLLAARYEDGMFEPYSDFDSEAALILILNERRKELVLRGSRWEDLRRLNKEHRLETTIVKTIDGQRFELPPGDVRWSWPIPDNVISRSGIQQNAR